MEIFLESSKTDQYRDVSRILVARTYEACCPVSIMEKYLGLIQTESCQERYDQCVFRGLVKTKQGCRSGSLSYTRLRELVLDKLESIGLDKRKFGVLTYVQEERRQLPMQVCQIGSLSALADGRAKLPKMANMLRMT